MIASLTKDNSQQIAKLHISGISTGFISLLGQEFVMVLYEAIAEVVLRLKNNPKLLKRFTAKSRQYASDNFSREALAVKYLKILERVVAENMDSAIKK